MQRLLKSMSIVWNYEQSDSTVFGFQFFFRNKNQTVLKISCIPPTPPRVYHHHMGASGKIDISSSYVMLYIWGTCYFLNSYEHCKKCAMCEVALWNALHSNKSVASAFPLAFLWLRNWLSYIYWYGFPHTPKPSSNDLAYLLLQKLFSLKLLFYFLI